MLTAHHYADGGVTHSVDPASLTERGASGFTWVDIFDGDEADFRHVREAYGLTVFGATLIAGIYGMNFKHMPELDWRFGYPLALGMMAALGLLLYRVFRLELVVARSAGGAADPAHYDRGGHGKGHAHDGQHDVHDLETRRPFVVAHGVPDPRAPHP